MPEEEELQSARARSVGWRSPGQLGGRGQARDGGLEAGWGSGHLGPPVPTSMGVEVLTSKGSSEPGWVLGNVGGPPAGGGGQTLPQMASGEA